MRVLECGCKVDDEGHIISNGRCPTHGKFGVLLMSIEPPPNGTDLWEYCETCGWYPAGKHDGLTHAYFDQLDAVERG